MIRVTLWVTLRLNRWLQKRSVDPSLYLSVSQRENEPLRLGRQKNVAYKANNQTSLERLVQQGSSVDTSGLNSSRVFLPAWAREIQPFLHNLLSEHTRRAYETDLKDFFRFLEGRIEPEALTLLRPEHIILFRKHLEEGRLGGKPLQKSTINRKLAVVKSFLNWLKLNHVIRDNPALLVKGYPQSQESDLKGFSDDEVRSILSIPRLYHRAGALHSAILHCLFYMGLRKSELIGLKVGDISEERGVPVIKVRGKGHRVRILPLVPIVRQSMDHYFKMCGRQWEETELPLFTPTKNPKAPDLLKPLNPNAITYIVLRYAKKAGVLKKVSPHSCRATCISNALDRKATHRSVQYLAGWSTPLMIQRYDKRREDLKNSAAFAIDYNVEPATG